MNSKKKVDLDKDAIDRFRRKEKQPLAIPDSILEEYRLDDETEIRSTIRRPPNTAAPPLEPPLAQYEDAHGYVFSWGHILERRVNQFVIWDFCLTHLLARCHKQGLRLRDLQRVVFAAIEAEVDCVSRETVMAVGLVGGWAIYPGTAVSAFTQVIHFASDEAARTWTADVLIGSVLPKAIAKARDYADRHGG